MKKMTFDFLLFQIRILHIKNNRIICLVDQYWPLKKAQYAKKAKNDYIFKNHRKFFFHLF